MTIEKLDGTSPRLYTLVAPLVMRRSVLRQNNNYPFWTSRSHTWFVAWEGENVYGFVPVEITDGGIARINNYYVSGDNPQLLARFLREVVQYYGRDYTIRSVTLIRHAEIFRTEGFAAIPRCGISPHGGDIPHRGIRRNPGMEAIRRDAVRQ